MLSGVASKHGVFSLSSPAQGKDSFRGNLGDRESRLHHLASSPRLQRSRWFKAGGSECRDSYLQACWET